MEIETDCIFSSESFDKYANNDRCRTSKERVQDFLDRGLMTQDAVYERYTEKLSGQLVSAYPGRSVIENIRLSFQQLRDSATGYLSSTAFKRLFAEKISRLGVNQSGDTSTLLCDVFTWHAFFPFPSACDGSGLLKIDESAFLRAVALLLLLPTRRAWSETRPVIHRKYGGTWGPYDGWYVALRGKDASDFRRWLFRSLATPDSSSIKTENVTTISVPRFEWSGYREDGSDPEDDPSQQFVVMDDETEASIDIVDVVSECPPEEDRLTMNPFRESYRLVLPSLPKTTDDLSSLYIPKSRLVGFLKLCQEAQKEHTEDTMIPIEEVDSSGKVGWENFEKITAGSSRLLASSLANIFCLLTESQGGNTVSPA
ncbi:hypothetical protein F4802DRAFT_565865 [Xylaria palmicola]|nr:hypothetical protein F4802DRAFT_565865 [Xylaria palmicola]